MSTTSASGSDASTTASIPDDWWDPAWRRRVRIDPMPDIVVDENEPGGVAVLVALTADRIDYDDFAAAGADVRFVGPDGAMALPHEIEQWDTTAVSTMWVRMPALSGDSVGMWMYYGNPGAADDQRPADVWGEQFHAVWHMTLDAADSTANGIDGTNTNAIAAEGRIGDALEFDGVVSEVLVGDQPGLQQVFVAGATVSAWVNPRGWGSAGNWPRILDKASMADNGDGYSLMLTSSGTLRFVQGFEGGEMGWETAADTVPLMAWTLVSLSYDASVPAAEPTLYLDGQLQMSVPDLPVWGPDPTSDVGVPMVLGARTGPETRVFDGQLDEVRVLDGTRSAQWHELQYRSMTDQLLVWGTPQEL